MKNHIFTNIFIVKSTYLQIFLLICTGVVKALENHKTYILLQQLNIYILLYELQLKIHPSVDFLIFIFSESPLHGGSYGAQILAVNQNLTWVLFWWVAYTCGACVTVFVLPGCIRGCTCGKVSGQWSGGYCKSVGESNARYSVSRLSSPVKIDLTSGMTLHAITFSI